MKPTPMMQQYLEIKEKHLEYILFFRLGDFYEMFFDDAITVSRELELTLTGKDCGLETRAPMCGIPYHAATTYIPRLIEKGYKIAICEQTEDAKNVAKGIVKREVVKIITPGTITDNNILDDKKNNYIACVYTEGKKGAVAYSDITTGEIKVSSVLTEYTIEKILAELARINPTEILVNSKEDKIVKQISKRFNSYISEFSNKDINDISNNLISSLNLESVNKSAIGIILNYIYETQKDVVRQINKVELYEIEKYMQLDVATRRNLEIIESNREKAKKGSLLWVLDKTTTAMGARMLTKWLQNPLLDKVEIEKRYNATEVLINEFIFKDELVILLKNVYDIERIISKVVNGSAMPRDLITLKNSIKYLPQIKELVQAIASKTADTYFIELSNKIDVLKDVYNLLESSLIEEAPIVIKDGGIIKLGYDTEIDELKEAKTKGASWLIDLEQKEKQLTNIKMLKVAYNRIFGYYIEVTNSYKSMVPKDRYITKQTLAGCERYITEELKILEEKILKSEDKLKDLEYKMYIDIRQKIGNEIVRIQETAEILAILDTLISYATVAIEYNYVKPSINEENVIDIEEGRHSVVEKALKETHFTPNCTYMNNSENMLSIITGPNMAGKSTYMRQVALISYMAQIGSYVPAKRANVCIVDRIFTRVGASDDLAMGESTFMVEMSELSNILKNATPKSLVILDEIGRGTSTHDGLAIAWATAEHIVNETKCKTLFATHYHELTELEDTLEGVKNYSVQIEENGEDIIFMHKIVRGSVSESYGIYVAKLAGLPSKTLTRAKHILKDLKITDVAKKKIEESKKIDASRLAVDMFNYNLNEIATIIEETDLDELSAREGLDLLYKLKEKLN